MTPYDIIVKQSRQDHVKELTLFTMGIFAAAHGWGGAKSPPPPKNLTHISHNNEIWHSYNLPKEDSKKI